MSLLENVRKRNPTIPSVFLMSGYSDISEPVCIAKGAIKVFSKPFDLDYLISETENTLNSIKSAKT